MSDVENAIRLAKIKLHVGPIHARVAGRTDHIPVHVPADSYVLPAHFVSGLGDGNTSAGFEVVKRTFGGLPYGAKGSTPYSSSEGPYGSELPRAGGGAIPRGSPIPCVLSGGEFVLKPEEVEAAGDGDIPAGHRAIDEWVSRGTKQLSKTIAKLPPPRRD